MNDVACRPQSSAMRFFRPCSRRGRLAFAATALLAGCSTAGPSTRQPLNSWELAGSLASVVMLRVVPGTPGATVQPAQDVLADAQVWAPASGWSEPTPLATPANLPSATAGAAGWLAIARPSGRHLIRLRASAEAPSQDFMVTVPDGRAAVLAGTFRRDCPDGEASCRLVPVPTEESAAREAIPEARRAGFPLVVAPAQPYPPRLAGTALPPPVAPAIRLDTLSWVSAVDWQAVLGEDTEIPEPPAGSFSNSGSDLAGALLIATGAIVILAPIAIVAMIAQSQRDQQARVAAEEARRRAEALIARAEAARAAWSPCEATIGAALSPDRVARHLDATFPSPRGARAGANPWQATVTRVVLRHCGQGPGTFGLEVATEWTGQAPGAATPAYRADFVRPVDGATPDTRLRWSTPAPWEVPVAPAGACRPLGEWCAAGGRALLDEVARSVAGARDAIAATR
jgi:hypothetical protein